ncbi:CpaD family pilus assembly protein [Mangrovicella endophytica]|uniref:CpaD family pilus assembly protein n=1 Tax=Mangrovicella endophytica TaxID=2066697 RepID=UPI001FE1ADFE|nr:CpaD family pilus assembly lipoprotein [Mangrovicella endophytica]
MSITVAPSDGRRATRRGASKAAATGAVLLAALVAGCANVQHVEVGAIPDDYRTRHPITVSEAEEDLEIPVASSETRLSEANASRIRAFAARFRASGAEVIRVMLPHGSTNEAAAELVSGSVLKTLRARGVAQHRILIQPYAAAGLSGPTPIRLAFVTLAAKTAPCGRWPKDLGDTTDNKNYFNFGCASQQNLAAQIADPRDLLGPRGVGEIDAERRTDMLDKYRRGEATPSERSPTESDYDW